jgi:hypothetical protein
LVMEMGMDLVMVMVLVEELPVPRVKEMEW